MIIEYPEDCKPEVPDYSHEVFCKLTIIEIEILRRFTMRTHFNPTDDIAVTAKEILERITNVQSSN